MNRNWWPRPFGRKNTTIRNRGASRARLVLEALEYRVVPAAFVPGSIQGQDGWTGGTGAISPSVDQAVDQGGSHAHAGVGAFHISNDTQFGDHNGAFGGWPFSPGLAVTAGQPSSGAGADRFTATYFFRTASATADGSNIETDLGTADGTDRNSFLAITNEADSDGGLQLRMAEPNPADAGNDFFYPTQIAATNISRGTWHRIDIQASFTNGLSNDTFQVSLDGVAIVNNTPSSPNNGTTSWGTFEGYRDGHGFPYALTNRLLFRSGAAPSGYGTFSDTAAQGFYVDDVSYSDFNSAAPATTLASYAASFEPAGTTVPVDYVNSSWSNVPLGADPDGAGPATAMGYDAFATIQGGVNGVSAGGTTNVAAGTYNEGVTVNKKVTLLGAQHGVDARTRAGAESIVNFSGGAFGISASDVTVDGFTLQGQSADNSGPGFGYAIYMAPGTTGTQVLNDIVQNNHAGIAVSNTGTHQVKIQQDLFQNNSSGLATDIYADQFTAGVGGVSNVLIDSNKFTNTSAVESSWALGISNSNATPFTGITFSNNSVTNHGRGVYFYNTTNVAVTGNDFLNLVGAHYAIGLFNGDQTVAITGNRIDGGYDGVQFADDFGTPNSGVTITGNGLSNLTHASIDFINEGGTAYSGTLDASTNYWGTSDPATVAASIISDAGPATPVDFTSLLDNNESVANQSVVGFQPDFSSVTVHTLGTQVGATGRIQEGVNLVSAGGTVHVAAGTYAENVLLNKALTLQGTGSTASDSVISVTSGNALTVQASNVTVSNLRIAGTSSTNGIFFDSAVSNTSLSNVVSTGHSNALEVHNSANLTTLGLTSVSLVNSTIGFRVATTGKVNGLTVVDSHFDNNQYGLYTNGDSSVSNNQTGFTGVNVSGTTTFNDNLYKGIYAEKLNAATFDGITVTNSGTGASSPAGIDINLKYGTYTGITIENATLTGNGTGAAAGNGLTIKARNDSPYNTNPASLSNVTLLNDAITGSPVDLAIGNNVNLNTVSLSGVSLSGSGRGLVVFQNTAGQTLSAGNTTFAGTLASYVEEGSPGTTVNATGATFNGTAAASLTLNQAYAVVDKIIDSVDAGTANAGFVRIQANTVFVTPNSFVMPLLPSVQRAIDSATSGDTIIVQAGSYSGGADAVTGGKNVVLNLTGTGVAGTVTITGDVKLDAGDTLAIDVLGTTAGTQYDQLQVIGQPSVGGATLAVTSSGYSPPAGPNLGDQFTIIDNDGSADSTLGNFAGLSIFSSVSINGKAARIRYDGGDGNDVVLTVTDTTHAVLGADGNIYFFGNGPSAPNPNDLMYVNANNPNNVLIQLNGVTLTKPGGGNWVIAPGQHFILVGDSGDDTIQLAGSVPGEIYGGAGSDTLTGGSGNDVIFGDIGNDIIDGGAGNDVLVGGAGADKLRATSGNDILVGGDFVGGSRNGNNWDYASLRQLGDAWASSGGTSGGAASAGAAVGTPGLSTSHNGTFVTDNAVVAEKDTFYAGSGNDWIIAASNDIVSSLAGNDYKQVL